MKKTVWIINHYAGRTFFDHGGRHYCLAKYLRRKGYNPVVFVANTKHGIQERWIENESLWTDQTAEEIETPFVFVKSSLYKGNGKKRIYNMFGFYRNVQKTAKEYANKYGKPDIIYASSVHPLTLIAGIRLAKFFGVKCISEVRDLWPESIFVYSNRINKAGLFAKLLYCGEKWIYRKSDALVFTMEGGPDYIKEHGWDKENGGPVDLRTVFHINNGVDLEVFDKNAEEFQYQDDELDDKVFFKVIYAGAIRRVNKVGMLIDAAKLLDPKKVRFFIFGSGDELEELRERVVQEGIENVTFKGQVNKQYVPSIDKRADLNVVHWEDSPLIKYGDSSNKSFEYYAAGKPILYTTRPKYSVVERYECGLTTDSQDPKSIAAGIQHIMDLNEDERMQMSRNARRAAEAYDYSKLAEKLIDIIEHI